MKLEDIMAKTTEARRRANAKYDASNTTQLRLKLNKSTDADIIEYLGSCPNKQGLIKDLLRQHIAKEKATD